MSDERPLHETVRTLEDQVGKLEAALRSRQPPPPRGAHSVVLRLLQVLGNGTVVAALVLAHGVFSRAPDAALLAILFACASLFLDHHGRVVASTFYALVGGAYAESLLDIAIGLNLGDQARITPVLLSSVLLHPISGIRCRVTRAVAGLVFYFALFCYVLGWFHPFGNAWLVVAAVTFIWLTERSFSQGFWSDPVARITLLGFTPMMCIILYGLFVPFEYGDAPATIANVSVGLAPALVMVWCAAKSFKSECIETRERQR